MIDTVTAIPPDLGIERYLFGTTVPGLISVCSVTPWRVLLTCVQSPGNCVVNPGALSPCVCACAAAGSPPSTVATEVTARIDLIGLDYPQSERPVPSSREHRQDQRDHGSARAVRGVRAALRVTRGPGVERGRVRGVRAAAPQRRPRGVPRDHALALGGGLPGVDEE